jgi:hypothetical protein
LIIVVLPAPPRSTKNPLRSSSSTRSYTAAAPRTRDRRVGQDHRARLVDREHGLRDLGLGHRLCAGRNAVGQRRRGLQLRQKKKKKKIEYNNDERLGAEAAPPPEATSQLPGPSGGRDPEPRSSSHDHCAPTRGPPSCTLQPAAGVFFPQAGDPTEPPVRSTNFFFFFFLLVKKKRFFFFFFFFFF